MNKEDLEKTIKKIKQEIKNVSVKAEGWESDLSLDGKQLEVEVAKHSSLLAYYDEISVSAKYILEYAEMIEKRIRGELFVECKETFKKEYSDSAIKQVVESNPLYLKIHEVYITAEECYNHSKMVVDAFKQRSFDLTNFIRIRENELTNVIIRI
jgi:RNA-splicing ligase RtcB